MAADRIIKLDKESKKAVEGIIELFHKKFGRDPGPDDPLIFDPDADTPQPMPEGKMEAMMGEIAEAAGLHPRFVYAIKKTGLLITESNYARQSDENKAAWNEAMLEYEMNNPGDN